MNKGSETRGSAAELATGSGVSQVQTGAEAVDVGKLVGEAQKTQAPGASAQGGAAGFVAENLDASNIASASAKPPVERKQTETAPVRTAATENTHAAATATTGTTPTATTRPADIAATMGGATRDTMQPAMHPGTPLVLNMSNGRLAAQSGGEAAGPATGAPAPVRQDNSIDDVAAPRSSFDFEPERQGADRSEAEARVSDEAVKIAEQRRRHANAAGRSEMRRGGVVEKPEKPAILTHANRVFKKIKELKRATADMAIKRKSFKGSSFYETIFSKPDLMPHCVSIGTENIRESLRTADSTLLDIVNQARLKENPDAEILTVEQCLADISILVDAINLMNLEVTLEKSPVNINHSIQVRTLRVHYGRGIGLHPTQTKAFNADYDGDPAVVNLDQTQLMRYARSMDRLVSIEGKALIDPDFFPLEEFHDKEEIVELLKMRNLSWDPSIASEIVDAYQAACNEGDWVAFLRKIDEIAEARSEFYGSRNEIASGILKSMYDFSIDRRALSIKTQMSYLNEEHSNYNPPDPGSDPFVIDLVNLTDEIVAGRPCPSIVEFTRFYHKYYGEMRDSEGRSKNVPFRLLADFAKAINRTDLITVGSDLFGIDAKGKQSDDAMVTIHDLWQFTCAAGLSKQISGRCYMGSRELAVSTQVRSMVLQECPIENWETEEAFRDWLHRFKDSYNGNTRMLKASQVGFRGGMMPVRDKSSRFDGIGDNFENVAEALVKVYGSFTVGHMFPSLIRADSTSKHNTGKTVARFYRNMPLEKFVMSNRLVFNSERGSEKSKFDAIADRLGSNDFTQMDILMLIADRRTKQLGDYHTQWMQMTEDHFDAISKIYEYSPANGYSIDDYNDYAESVMEIIELMSPDMFLHFGMESPATFRNSKWGKRLLGAESLDVYRSVLYSMMVEYRLGKSSGILTEMKETEDALYQDGSVKVEKLEELDSAFEIECEILASSSMAWNTIVDETMNGSMTFRTLMESNGVYKSGSETWHMHGKMHRRFNQETGQYEWVGISFWDRPAEEKEKYRTLLSFLKSSEPIDVKMAVLADVVRVHERYPNITPSEMLGQTAYHPDRLHAGSRFDMDKGIRGDIDSLKESIERLSSYREKTPDRIREQARKVLDKAHEDKAGFEKHLSRLADDPGYAVYVDPILAADAIASIYDKTYADSEKIHQQAAVNGYFGCVSYQRSGGYYTHLYMSDNAVVNMVGYDQLTSQDILRVLSDPDVKITVYDEFGTPETISRLSLCGGNTIDDVIAYLEENPRVALLCRRQVAGISSDVDGTARLNALNDNEVFDTPEYAVFSLLDDRPKFLATAALVTPSDGDVGRNISERISESLTGLCSFVLQEATGGKTGNELVKDIEDSLGLSVEKIIALRKEGSYDPADIDITDEQAAQDLYAEVIGEMLDCVDIVRSSSIGMVESASAGSSFKGSIDQTSMIAYYDARQQIGGARTATMIGVEGSETKKNLVLKVFLENHRDAYTMSEDGTTVIPLVPGLDQASDQSLVKDQRLQTGSAAKYLEVKRENGAETYNAKYKKYGDDGTNSMIKFIRSATNRVLSRFGKRTESKDLPNDSWSIEDGQALLDRISRCEKKFEAVPILAQALIDADARLGYIDVNRETGQIEDDSFIPSDYWNRADLMIAENSDGTLVVRTMEQLSAACRTRISDDAVVSGDIDTVMEELEQIIATVGTDMDPMFAKGPGDVAHSCIYGIRLHNSVGKARRIDRAMRQRSSSTERNYSLMVKMCKDFKERMHIDGDAIPSRKTIEEISVRKFAELKRVARSQEYYDLDSQLKGIAYPVDSWYRNDLGKWVQKENPQGSREYIYDYLGTSKDADLRLIPGPTSLVLFAGDYESQSDSFNARLQQCLDYGITAAFAGDCLEHVPADIIPNLIQVSQDIWILPCFDIKLNGAFSPSIMEAPAEIPANPDNSVVNVEDTSGEFKSGDAVYHITRELANRIRVHFRGQSRFTAERLFPNVMRMFPYSDYEIDYCTNEEVQKYILNAEFDPETLTMKGFEDAVVDIGVMPGNPSFEREKYRFALRLQEYKEAFESADQDSILTGDCRYDSIVGFVKIKVDNNFCVLAPVWPFHLEESGKVPTTFAQSKFELDHSTNSFVLDWAYTGGIEDQYIKAFEGIGASTKLVTSSEYARSRQLENGLAVDGFYYTASVSSRLFPSNKRLHTMISAMMITRIDPKYAYNFAMLDGSFPGEHTITREDGTVIDVKEALLDASLSMADWKAIRDANIMFHSDPDINSIVSWWVDKCVGFGTVNPVTLLATKSRNGILWPKITEFESFLDTGYKFQAAWMKLMHAMNPTLMPESIDADPKGCLFRPVSGDASKGDYGVLQMRVPHFDSDGEQYFATENVYISMGFFGEEFSGFKKVNFNAYRRSIDNLNVAGRINGDDLVNLLTFARSEMSGVQPAIKLEAVPDNAMKDAFPKDEVVEDPHKRILDRKTWGKTLALTGHRPGDLWGYDLTKENYRIVADKLAKYCREHNIDTIISGMALGFDQLGAQVAIDNGLKLVAAVPFDPEKHASGSGWPQESIDRYFEILGHADKVVIVSPGGYEARKMQVRNEWMVDNADDVFALWNGQWKNKKGGNSGTGNCVRYARRGKKHIEILDPQSIR